MSDGPLYNVCSNQAVGTVPVYRVNNGREYHMTTLTKGEANWATDFQMGFVYNNQIPGTKPIYRRYLHSNGDHMTSVDPNEGGASWQTDFGKPMFYAF